MTTDQPFTIRLYSTATFIAVLLILIVLGVLALLGAQMLWAIPALAQVAFLTAWIAASFIVTPRLSTHPATVRIAEHSITLEPRAHSPRNVKAADIESYACYEELLLHSLKITLRGGDTLSAISFKGQDRGNFDTLTHAIAALAQSANATDGSASTLQRKTFYASRAKVTITLILLTLFSTLSILLIIRNAFQTWNPVVTYFYWVMPLAFFIKMWRAR